MIQDDSGLEQRLSRFEAQLDRFSLALHQWQAGDHARPSPDLEVDQRIRALEQTLGREAQALRLMHQEPLKQLEEQAASLRELCDAATTSVSGLDQAELRLTELQAHVGLLVTELSRSIQSLSTLNAPALTPAPPRGAAASWPLERVVHLHDELRRTGNGHGTGTGNGAGNGNGAGHDDVPGETTDDGVFHGVAGESTLSASEIEERQRRRRYMIGGAIVLGLAITIGLVRWIEGRLDDASARVASAERQVVATTRLANEEVAAARADANRQIAEARELAQRAETVGAILTAPDLVRFNLTSTVANGSSAQVSWSRTRGLVLSGLRLPATPPENTYQLWLVTGTQSVSAGVFVPDSTGRATLVVDEPPRVAGPVVGAGITVEPKGGRATPSGQMLLARFP
jgi:hypothetical protein